MIIEVYDYHLILNIRRESFLRIRNQINVAGIVPDLRYILRSNVKDYVAKLTAKVIASFLI